MHDIVIESSFVSSTFYILALRDLVFYYYFLIFQCVAEDAHF